MRWDNQSIQTPSVGREIDSLDIRIKQGSKEARD